MSNQLLIDNSDCKYSIVAKYKGWVNGFPTVNLEIQKYYELYKDIPIDGRVITLNKGDIYIEKLDHYILTNYKFKSDLDLDLVNEKIYDVSYRSVPNLQDVLIYKHGIEESCLMLKFNVGEEKGVEFIFLGMYDIQDFLVEC